MFSKFSDRQLMAIQTAFIDTVSHKSSEAHLNTIAHLGEALNKELGERLHKNKDEDRLDNNPVN